MILRFIAVLILLALLAGGVAAWAVLSRYSGYGTEVFVNIPPGTSSGQMAQMLAEARVIRHPLQFTAVRALNAGTKLQAGEYRFHKPMNALEVLRKIASGDVYYHEVRVPEGSNIWDISEAVGNLPWIRSQDFLQIARDPSMIRDLAPQAPSLEGYLFPSTYRFTRNTTAEQIAREMTRQFRKAWGKVSTPGLDVNRAVTIASLVEKETAVPSERPLVSSVYHNRIAQGWRLDADPTIIYAALLEGRYRGTIYRSDIDSTNPYNTYRRIGLPPGPIASPGLEALRAAVNPADTAYLFFVAKGDGSGGHVFTETLTQHNAAVQSYRNATAP